MAESFNKIALACLDIFLETEHDAKHDRRIKHQTLILKIVLKLMYTYCHLCGDLMLHRLVWLIFLFKNQ